MINVVRHNNVEFIFILCCFSSGFCNIQTQTYFVNVMITAGSIFCNENSAQTIATRTLSGYRQTVTMLHNFARQSQKR